AAFWCATLEAWGFPFERLGAVVEGEPLSTLVVPAACVDAGATGTLERLRGSILIGPPWPAAACLSSIRVPGSAGSLDRMTSDAEPSSFPIGAEYYNHSFTHPYSYWNEEPWEALDHDAMHREIARARDLYRDRLATDDRGLFRLPHFQLEAWDRTADVLEELG